MLNTVVPNPLNLYIIPQLLLSPYHSTFQKSAFLISLDKYLAEELDSVFVDELSVIEVASLLSTHPQATVDILSAQPQTYTVNNLWDSCTQSSLYSSSEYTKYSESSDPQIMIRLSCMMSL